MKLILNKLPGSDPPQICSFQIFTFGSKVLVHLTFSNSQDDKGYNIHFLFMIKNGIVERDHSGSLQPERKEFGWKSTSLGVTWIPHGLQMCGMAAVFRGGAGSCRNLPAFPEAPFHGHFPRYQKFPLECSRCTPGMSSKGLEKMLPFPLGDKL